MTRLRFLVIGPGPDATCTGFLVIGPRPAATCTGFLVIATHPTSTAVTKGPAVLGCSWATDTRMLAAGAGSAIAAGAGSAIVAALLVNVTGPVAVSRVVVTGPGPSVSRAKQRGIWQGRLYRSHRN